MDSLLRATEIFGKLIFCVPANALLESWRLGKFCKLKIILLSLVHVILLFEGLVLFFDTTFNNSVAVVTLSPRLSEHLGYYFQYVAVNFSDFIIRAAGLIFASDASKLFLVLRLQGCKFVHTRSIPFIFMLFSLLLVSGMVIGYAYALIKVNINFKLPSSYVLSIAPKDETSFLVYELANSIAASASILFSWFFVIVVSTCLVCWLRSHCEKCCRAVRESAAACMFDRKTKIEVACASLRLEFMSIREAFEGFGRIGGLICLTLLVQCSLLFIRFLSEVAIPVKSTVAFSSDSHYFCYLLPFAAAIIGVLGSMMAKAVRGSMSQLIRLTQSLTGDCCCN